VRVEGRIIGQPVVVRNVPGRGAATVYVGTSAGRVYAFAPNGYVRWQADFGQLGRPCTQLDGYGVTGTPVVDAATRALYAADAFGRLHALDLATGAERGGWPVRLYSDFQSEHVFGGLTAAAGYVYVPTGSYCDGPMEGKLIRVSTATGAVLPWIVVPARLGGGGGIWSFGGAAYSARRHSLFVATGNALRGGTNVGRRYRESAGLGERLVELSLDLAVRASSHPGDVRQKLDLDFSGGPVIIERSGCGELAVALNKNGRLYAWRTSRLRAGPIWSAQLRPGADYIPAIGQPAWSPRQRSFYFAIGDRLTRLEITAACRPRIVWRAPVSPAYTHGSPVVAGRLVWLSVSGHEAGLVAVDSATGTLRRQIRLDGDAYAAPAVFNGSLYLGTFSGAVHGLVARRERASATSSDVPGHLSFADSSHAWQARESGVFATADGGAHWRRIFHRPAERVVRASLRFGAVSTGFPAPRCACRSRVYWTRDGGRHWRETTAIGGPFEGRGTALYWRRGARLYETRLAAGRRLRTHRIARVRNAVIVDLAKIPGGVAALVSHRMRGSGWDKEPKLLLATRGRVKEMRLPAQQGWIVVRSLSTAWPAVIVHGLDLASLQPVKWTSADGGASWHVNRAP